MNALRISDRTPTSLVPRSTIVPATTPSRPPRRERDFGIGYGTSSGYGSTRHYAPTHSARLFRCV